MSLLLRLRKPLFLSVLLAAFPNLIWGQIAAVPQGNENSTAGSLVGDQIHSSLSLNQSGGYLVWEENSSLKNGKQISAARLDSSFTKISSFTVNKVAKGDQINPQVQLLGNGNAIFVWQNYGLGNADIFARVLKNDGSFATGDFRVNSDSKAKGSYAKDQQSKPAVCALSDGGAFIAWQSFAQDGSKFGIYARTLSAAGVLSNEFSVNQTTLHNQRSPAVANLANGNVIVAWVSEWKRFGNPYISIFNATNGGASPSVDIYGRIFSATGQAISDEMLLSVGNNFCANPSIAALSSGGFTVVWSEKDIANRTNSWEIMGRSFSADGVPDGADFKINSNSYGDQYLPKIARVGNDCAVVWTSLGQDGSHEGVFGRLLQGGTQLSGDEFRANNTTISRQIDPAIAADGSGRFLVSWSSFVRTTGFDLFTRKFIVNQQQ